MKAIRSIIGSLFITVGLIAWPGILDAQISPILLKAISTNINGQAVSVEDLDTMLEAIEATLPVPVELLPRGGNYFSAAHLEWPPLPTSMGFNAWQISSNIWLLDDLEAEAERYAMQALDIELPGFYGGNGTNGYQSNYSPRVFTTNDLWLEIVGTTNTGTGLTVNLTIHTPWNDTNLTHDLFYTTDLVSPINWHFLMRCISTNVIVPDLCEPQGFFRLSQTNGNLTVTTNATPQQLAQLLVPPWVIVTNATNTGAVVARGTFAGGNGCGLPIDSGVILASGPITNAIGPNNDSGSIAWGNGSSYLGQPNDADLDSLVGGGPTYDAAVLEFDLISTNSFTLQFQYIFASEEYPEWIGQYNDPMAIFVTTNRVGKNWINTITNDIALVPDTTNIPVSVNTINGGGTNEDSSLPILPTNPQYYVDNHDPDHSAMPPYAAPAPVFNIQYDGMTVLLTAQTNISANVTYHIKIAIADFGDHFFDSAVFIKSWSSYQFQ